MTTPDAPPTEEGDDDTHPAVQWNAAALSRLQQALRERSERAAEAKKEHIRKLRRAAYRRHKGLPPEPPARSYAATPLDAAHSAADLEDATYRLLGIVWDRS